MDFTDFDSEVMQLVQDLGLVLTGSEEHLRFLAAMSVSRYANYHFCERYRDHLVEVRKINNWRSNGLHRPYLKSSHHDELCAHNQFKLPL